MADDPANPNPVDPNPTDPNPTPKTDPAPKPAPAADPAPAPAADPKPGVISDPSPEPKPDPAADKGELQKLRETLAGGDDKLLKELERYKSVDSIAKMVREARVAARNAGKPVTLGDKPTEDEVKAYREAHGIPEEADAYPVSFREDYKPSEADTEILDNFKAAMHERNVPPAAAAAALDWYQDFAQEQQQALDANLANVAKKTQADLRAEMGGEFEGTMGAVREFMTSQLGKDGFDEMMGLRLMDGSRLQDNPAFVKMMAQVSTDYYGSNAIYNGDIETTSKTVQERIDELLKLRTEKPEEYKSDAVQAEITKLYAQRNKINARKG
ncbi:MAG: hypothetical protein ACTHJQ_25860 [Rhizobiaceae bacterium]